MGFLFLVVVRFSLHVDLSVMAPTQDDRQAVGRFLGTILTIPKTLGRCPIDILTEVSNGSES